MGLFKLFVEAVFAWLLCGLPGVMSGTQWDGRWYNSSSPSAANNFTDLELSPGSGALASVCDTSDGSKLTARCKDEKGEPFYGFLNDTIRMFTATCDPIQGLKCTPMPGYNLSCPDFAIQFGCNLKTTTSAPTLSTGSWTNGIGTIGDGTFSNATGTYGIGYTVTATNGMGQTGTGSGNKGYSSLGYGGNGGGISGSGSTGSGSSSGSGRTVSGSSSGSGSTESGSSSGSGSTGSGSSSGSGSTGSNSSSGSESTESGSSSGSRSTVSGSSSGSGSTGSGSSSGLNGSASQNNSSCCSPAGRMFILLALASCMLI